jgi:hypothetical protein
VVFQNGTLTRGVAWYLPRRWSTGWWWSIERCIVYIKRTTDIIIGAVSPPRDARIIQPTAVVDWQAELVWWWWWWWLILTKSFDRWYPIPLIVFSYWTTLCGPIERIKPSFALECGVGELACIID